MEYIPVSKPYFWGEEIINVTEAMESGWISSSGKFIDEFEQRFTEATGSKYAIAVSNGTCALHLACDIIGLKSGDEVIVADFSMIAPLFALEYLGCVPVPVDVDETWNLDSTLVEGVITEKTKAILVVHNYGHPADMDRIMTIAKKHKLKVIEDGAEAIGATLRGMMVGEWGDITCYSLYANKIITCGEGGMITTNEESLFLAAKSKRNMSFGSSPNSRFIHEQVGYNYRLTNTQAAIGCAQIKYLNKSIEKKIDIANHYLDLLDNVKGISLPPCAENTKNVYWVFGILINDDFGISKTDLQHELKKIGIETRDFFEPVHKQPFLKKFNFDDSKYKKSKELALKGFYLPSYIGLSYEQIKKVVDTIIQIQSRKTQFR